MNRFGFLHNDRHPIKWEAETFILFWCAQELPSMAILNLERCNVFRFSKIAWNGTSGHLKLKESIWDEQAYLEQTS